VTFSLNVGNFYLLDVFNITTETSSTLQAECYSEVIYQKQRRHPLHPPDNLYCVGADVKHCSTNHCASTATVAQPV